ncbi:CubicO group peptidase, beta-lactamase class C family [Haloechinothrix alba]|uniref:CubicO group peptidase, beta-lactamase class C family n=1 Tax=Haloechinothrix alba TaxID=664784 RepID=A0A238V0X4_9PSEU|nr:serine hydrolase domain-containing protein [Haloechinothrix alba]SNR27878.1 CubicO group peptidase, beta-lactamase class C family [Haloechinothrix alba]
MSSARRFTTLFALVTLLAAGQLPGQAIAQESPEDLVRDRAEIVLDPGYWFNYVHELLAGGTLVLPVPIDVVKPEVYLPTDPVASGDDVWELPRRDQDLLGVDYEWRGRTKTVEDFLRDTETDAVAFVHDGHLVADYYTNGWSADQRHQAWSVTKSFTSTLVGEAVDDRLVRSVDDPIEAYIDELHGTAWEGVTIENLLEMESGVHWDESTPVLAENTQVQQWIQLALDLYTDGALGKTRNEFLMSLPRTAEPGTEFSYNSGNSQVLAWLVETVYGQPFSELLTDKLWKPVGMAADAEILTDRVGDAIASQSLYATTPDLARLGELFRNDGRVAAGPRVVSRKWVREATTMTDTSDGQYGYQWWRGVTPDGYAASGFQGQRIEVSPADCLTGVRFAHNLGVRARSDDGDPGGDGFDVTSGNGEWGAVYRAVADELDGCRGRASGG